jgi:transitional endoplasmic reticulum ATPase
MVLSLKGLHHGSIKYRSVKGRILMEIATTLVSPEERALEIFQLTGLRFEPETAAELWKKIEQHKWFLSERLGRDVGFKVAAIDFVENSESAGQDLRSEENVILLRELGAQMVDPSVWDTISESQPPKRIVNKQIILPLTEMQLAQKHGVIPPKAIIFFGPPGTGKTHFVKAIAGVLHWWYIEVSPSDLMADGQDRVGSNLKRLLERVANLDEAVIFIDEFEEIAGNRDQASRLDKSITNEFLKQIPIFKRQSNKVLLVCATNFIGQLDTAMLRPGRFDCIIPVGGLDEQGRRTIFEYYLSLINSGEVDVQEIVSRTPLFTPADIEYLFQKVSQKAFEKELDAGSDYRVDTKAFLEMIEIVRPTLTPEIIEEFSEDCSRFTRY